MITVKYKGDKVRIVEVQGVKYLILRDIMQVLGMKSNATVYKYTAERDRTIVTATDCLGSKRKMAALNSKALNQLLAISTADYGAKEFLRLLDLTQEKAKIDEAAKLYSDAIREVAKENVRLKKEISNLRQEKNELMEMYTDEVNELTDEILEAEDTIEEQSEMINERNVQIDNLLAEKNYLEETAVEKQSFTEKIKDLFRLD